MSKTKDPLKDIIAQRYKTLEKEDYQETQLTEATYTEVYVPRQFNNKYCLVKIQYSLAIDGFILNKNKCNAKVVDMVEIDQKIIVKLYSKDQENLKYYFEKSKKKENK